MSSYNLDHLRCALHLLRKVLLNRASEQEQSLHLQKMVELNQITALESMPVSVRGVCHLTATMGADLFQHSATAQPSRHS